MADIISNHLWHNGLAVIPLVILATLLTRWFPSRPATRHTLWVMILLWLILPPMLPSLSGSQLSEWIVQKTELVETVAKSKPISYQEFHAQTPVTPAKKFSPEKNFRPTKKINPVARWGERLSTIGTRNTRPSARIPDVRTGSAAQKRNPLAYRQEKLAPQTLARDRKTCRPMVGNSLKTKSKHRTTLAERKEKCGLQKFKSVKDAEVNTPSLTEIKMKILYSLALDTYRSFKNKYIEARQEQKKPLYLTANCSANDSLCGKYDVRNHGQTSLPMPPSPRAPDKSGFNFARGSFRLDALSKSDFNKPGVRSAFGVHQDHPTPLWPNKNPDNRDQTVNNKTAGEALSLVEKQNETPARPWIEWVSWIASVSIIWKSIVALPPIPTSLWFGVTTVLFLIVFIRVFRFKRYFQTSRPASKPIKRMVAEAADHYKLRYTPKILMVEGRISPMIWCGLKPKLILPIQLWSQLDDVGRRAVIFHELAHLRRGDHWINWIDLFIGQLFWWHPLVWWVRHRLHAEAENCCDAWVTTLMPQTRRAYAETLLKTKQYLSTDQSSVAVIGIGITSGRARRFARRITMVMTQSVKPRLSISGLVLVLSLAMTGWLTSPVRSNEPAPKVAIKPVPSIQFVPVAEEKIVPVVPAVEYNKSVPKSTYVQHVDGKKLVPSLVVPLTFVKPLQIAPVVAALGLQKGEQSDEKRLRKLERKMEKLSRQLEKIVDSFGEKKGKKAKKAKKAGKGKRRGDGRTREERESRRPRAPREPRAPRAPRAGHPAHPAHPEMFFEAHDKFFSDRDNKETWKTYRLSKGKLKPFTTLMVRPDVPTKVRPNDKSIDILATKRQHATWHRFFQMIDPSDERASNAPDFDQFFALAGIGDCCGNCSGSNKGCCQNGKGCCGGDSKCNSDCKSNCGPGCSSSGRSSSCGKCKAANKIRIKAKKIRDKIRSELTEIRSKTRGKAEYIRERARKVVERVRNRLRAHAYDARSNIHFQRELIEGLDHQRDALMRQAEELREQAQRVREQANEVQQHASEITNHEEHDGAFHQHMEAMEVHSRAMEEQARHLEEQSREIEENFRAIEEQIQNMDQHAEDLDQRAEAIEDATHSLDDLESSPELANSIIALARHVDTMANPMISNTTETIQNLIDHSTQIAQENELKALSEISGKDTDR